MITISSTMMQKNIKMGNVKKWMCSLFAISLTFLIFSCGGDKSEDKNKTDGTSQIQISPEAQQALEKISKISPDDSLEDIIAQYKDAKKNNRRKNSR